MRSGLTASNDISRKTKMNSDGTISTQVVLFESWYAAKMTAYARAKTTCGIIARNVPRDRSEEGFLLPATEEPPSPPSESVIACTASRRCRQLSFHPIIVRL